MSINFIAKYISKNTFLNSKESRFFIEKIVDILKSSLKDNNKIEIRGFGSFYPTLRKGKYIKLKSKKDIISKEHIGIIFKASPKFLKNILESDEI